MNVKDLTEQIELVSQKYADKFGIQRDEQWFFLKLQEEIGELLQSYLSMTGQAKHRGQSEQELRENFEKELADVICHALLIGKKCNIDVEKVIQEKWLTWNRK